MLHLQDVELICVKTCNYIYKYYLEHLYKKNTKYLKKGKYKFDYLMLSSKKKALLLNFRKRVKYVIKSCL